MVVVGRAIEGDQLRFARCIDGFSFLNTLLDRREVRTFRRIGYPGADWIEVDVAHAGQNRRFIK
jgi:hypothetical protein